MLRLLAQREQGYDDIAALMGLSVEEVRAKVAGALSQIEDEGKPAPDVPPPEPKGPEIDGPADGGSEPSKAAASGPLLPKQPGSPPKPVAPTGPKSEPGASAEKPPAPKATPARPEPKAAASAGGGSSGGARTVTIPSGRGLWPWIGGAAAIIAIVVIVIIIAGGGGDSSSSSTAATTTAGTAEDARSEAQAEEAEAEAAEESGEAGEKVEEGAAGALAKGVTQAVLKPVSGHSGAGKAIFGRVKNKLALQVVASGLETTGKDDAYTIWLAQSEQKMLPLASSAVAAKSKGKIAAQYEVPTEVLSYLANGTFDEIFITHTDNAQLAASLKEATQKKEAPGYVGEPVLKGTVTGPIVGAALREEEEEKEAEEKGE
jgi:hypothetical protein